MGERPGEAVLAERGSKTRKAPLYRVILHNDDYTTMEFVVEILETVFHKSPAEAHRIMMHVHTRERATCGAYPFEVAETKVGLVHERAKEAGFPLRASLEEESC
ncbi:MAG: ATP-dependent Clp protease adaptor ClpS [Thermoanaerobaculia bacterium]